MTEPQSNRTFHQGRSGHWWGWTLPIFPAKLRGGFVPFLLAVVLVIMKGLS